MTSAQSILRMSAAALAGMMDSNDILASARTAGILAARRAPELIPSSRAAAITGAEVTFAAEAQRIRITATVDGDGGADMAALTAAAIAALTLYDVVKTLDRDAAIEGVSLVAHSAQQLAPQRRSAGMRGVLEEATAEPAARAGRARPSVLMGEVAAPRAGAPSSQRDAFRAFMAGHRLRATEWAKDAGVPVGEILAFLTGRSRSLSGATAERLARAAKVRPEDMFR